MGKLYRQFSVEERFEIARLSAEGRSIRQIAAGLDRAPSSVARELKRNSGTQVGYKPAYAQQQAQARRWSGSRLDRDAALREQVLGQLRAGWSPEQIAGRSRRAISAETIYRFIYAQITRHNDFSWRHYLPRAKFKRGRRKGKGGSPALHMAQRVPLSERPAEVEQRLVPGHWEADLMAFARHGQNLLMLHERMSRALIGTVIPSKHAQPVAIAIGSALSSQLSAPALAPYRHLRQWHRVRSPLRTQRHRHQDLLLRPARPLAKGRHRERHRPYAPLPASQDRSRSPRSSQIPHADRPLQQYATQMP
jgi:IS30 family transposase